MLFLTKSFISMSQAFRIKLYSTELWVQALGSTLVQLLPRSKSHL